MVVAGVVALGLAACSPASPRELPRAIAYDRPGDRALDRTLVVGTLIEATVPDARAWRRGPVGRRVLATVTGDVTNALHWAVIPAGSLVELRITRRGPGALTAGAGATITLELHAVTVRGLRYPVRAAWALSPVAGQPSRDAMGSAETRILFVLSEGFTAVVP